MMSAMKISIAELKRMLPVGSKFIATYSGPLNTKVFGNLGVTEMKRSPEETETMREVMKQTGEMVSRILTGPKAGRDIYLNWKGVTAQKVDGEHTVVLLYDETGTEFLQIRWF